VRSYEMTLAPVEWLCITNICSRPKVNGQLRSGTDGAESLKELTGLPLSTYFSAIKLRWMIDNWEDTAEASERTRLTTSHLARSSLRSLG